MKAEILSSTAVRITGTPPTAEVTRALEPWNRGNLTWEVPPSQVPDGLIPEALRALAARDPLPPGPVSVPDALWTTLFPYQQDGVRRIVHQFKGRCLLADEMGLGKTLQALASVLHFDVPTLIICPAFLQTTWRRTVSRWTDKATVCSFGRILPTEPGMIVVDEAHYLKTLESRRTQTILPMLLLAERVLLLSGTPCPNRPAELYPLLHAIRPSLAPDFHSFAGRYCNPRRTPFCAYDTRGSDRADELKWLLGRAYWVRRRKQDVLVDLPDKLQGTLWVDAAESSRREIETLRCRLDTALARGSKLAQTVITSMYVATARAKMAAAVSLVAGMLADRDKAIIFAHHRCMLDAMEDALPRDGSVGRIDGRTPLGQRQRVVDAMEDGTISYALLSMGAAGVGLNLTAASTAFFLEIPWCPAVLRQCEDRIHRIGQGRVCNIYYVLAHDTLDTYVWRTIHRKERVVARLAQ